MHKCFNIWEVEKSICVYDTYIILSQNLLILRTQFANYTLYGILLINSTQRTVSYKVLLFIVAEFFYVHRELMIQLMRSLDLTMNRAGLNLMCKSCVCVKDKQRQRDVCP